MKSERFLIEALYILVNTPEKREKAVSMLRSIQDFFLKNKFHYSIGRILSNFTLSHQILSFKEMESLIENAEEIVITYCSCQDYSIKELYDGRKEFYFSWDEDSIEKLKKMVRPSIHYCFEKGGLAPFVKKFWNDWIELDKKEALDLCKIYKEHGALFTSTRINPLKRPVGGICTCFNLYNTCINLRQHLLKLGKVEFPE